MKSSKLARASAILLALTASLDVASAQSLLRDQEIEDFIDDLAFPIFRAAGLPAEDINILLIGDQTPNAFAGGLNMGIHTGLLTAADTPNQIEGVIAHEAGHIAGGHTARSDDALAAATRPILLSLVLAAGAVAAGAPQAGIGLLGLGQNIGRANLLKYSRGQESSADQAAVTYLDGVGHSSEGLIEFFGKLRNYQVITGRRVNPYLQSHPLANARMTALTRRATASPYREQRNTPEEILRLDFIKAKIAGFLQQSHYTLRQYPLSDQSDPARYARAVAYYRASDIDNGLKEINLLIAAQPENPFFHELKGQMLFEFGRVKDSIAPHRRSVELSPQSALLRINLGRALLASEEPEKLEEAIKEFRVALDFENDNTFGWFELSRAYGYLGKVHYAHLASAEFRYHNRDTAGANQFARRALPGLKKNSAEWREAMDIILTTQGDNGPPIQQATPNQSPQPPAPERKERGEVPDPPA